MKLDRNRRKVLKMLPALAVVTPSGLQGAAKEVKEVEDHRLATVVLEVFSGQESARVVGTAYLDHHPQDASFSKLMAHLKADLDLLSWYRDGASASELRRRLHARAAIDYGNDDCVEIAGCYMPVTELRLCALSVIS